MSAVLQTEHLGEIGWDRASEIVLPFGLPGFESERRMIPVEIPAQRPLVYLQSVTNTGVCFVALPVRTVQPDYELDLSEEDRATLHLDDQPHPVIGEDVLCLALVAPHADGVRVNLHAPIVINLHNSRCLQVFTGSSATGTYRLTAAGAWERACS